MQAPTQNARTQGQHGAYNAVDYDDQPDPVFYAPEAGTITQYTPNNGDCGNSLRLQGANGLHGFCHLERPLVSVGQQVSRGQPLGVMGYTGYTDPDNVPAGTHLHWILNKGNVWVYPPSLVTEPFTKQGADMNKLTKDQFVLLFWMSTNKDATKIPAVMNNVGPDGMVDWQQAVDNIRNYSEYKDFHYRGEDYDRLEKAYKELEKQGPGDKVQVGTAFGKTIYGDKDK